MMEVVYVVCDSVGQASLIGKALVEENLCACVNILPVMHSIYAWEGEIVEDKEAVLLIKTMSGKFESISQRVKELHSYDTPAIFTLETKDVDPKYLNWIKETVK